MISEDITDEIAADVGNRDVVDMKLPANKADYMRMSVAEKVCCYPFDAMGTESAFARRQKVWHFVNFRRRIIGNGWSR